MNPVFVLPAAVAALVTGVLVGHYGLLVVAGLLGFLLVAGYLGLLLRWPERGLWLLALVLPYERIGTLPVGFFTLKLGHLVSAFMVASWAAKSILRRGFRLVYDPLRIPLLLFLAAGIFSLAVATDLKRGMLLLSQLVIGYLVYLLVINFLGARNLKGTLIALWASSLLVALFGLFQFVGDFAGLPTSITGLLPQYSGAQVFGFARIQSTGLEPLYFANYLLLPLLTAAAYLVGTRGRRRLLLVPFLLLLLVVFVLTLARGAYLGLGLAGLLLLLIYRREIFTPRVLATLLLSVTFIATTVGVLLLSTSGSSGGDPLAAFKNQISSSGRDVSSQQRLGAIAAAKELFVDHPISGVGIGSFGSYYQDPATGSPRTPQVVNNQTLEILAETGLLGFLAFLSVVAVLIERTARAARRVGRNQILRAALIGSALAVLAIGVQAQTFSAIYLMHVWFAIGLLVGVQNLILLPLRDQPE